MPFYKDTNNGLHFLDDDCFIYLLTPDCVQISNEEAAIMQQPPPPPPPTNAELLAETDQYMSRITEDTVVNLLLKGTVTKADYPQIVWDRINYRRSLRNQQPI